MLDLVFTDDDCLITDVKPCPPLGHSDHSSVELTHMSSIKTANPLLLTMHLIITITCGIEAIMTTWRVTYLALIGILS